MKKQLFKICIIFLSFLPLCGLLLHADNNNFLKSVEQSYQAGDYTRFLKSLDDEYKKAGKAGIISSVHKEMNKWNSTQESDLFQDFRVKELCSENADVEICKKINAIASLALTDQQIEAVKFFHSLKNKKQEKGDNSPEGKLAAVQAEYDIKMALLKLAIARKDKAATLDAKKKIVLNLDKFKKMEQVASKFPDPRWKALVQNAKAAFANSYEARSEFAYLKDLAAGKVSPKDQTEEKMKELVNDFLAKSEAR